jgi:phage FluMu protein Com
LSAFFETATDERVGEALSRRQSRLAKTLTLSPKELLLINRARWRDGLICSECGRLLATHTASYAKSNLTEEQRLAYVCAECLQARLDAAADAARRAEAGARLQQRSLYSVEERAAIEHARSPQLAELWPDGRSGPFPGTWAIAGPGFGSTAAAMPDRQALKRKIQLRADIRCSGCKRTAVETQNHVSGQLVEFRCLRCVTLDQISTNSARFSSLSGRPIQFPRSRRRSAYAKKRAAGFHRNGGRFASAVRIVRG